MMIDGIFFPVEAGIAQVPTQMVSYRLCSDGIYLQKKAGCGYVTVKVDGIGNAPKGVESINTLPRQIPVDAYYKTVTFFRDVEKKFGAKGTEAYVIVAYNPTADNFFLWVPKQAVGAASVDYDISGFHTIYPGCVILMDIHSHTSAMDAFWSGVDDKDDNRDRYSMVIGKINQHFPAYKIRFSTMKKRFDQAFDDIFISSDELVGITSDYLDQVTKAEVRIDTFSKWPDKWPDRKMDYRLPKELDNYEEYYNSCRKYSHGKPVAKADKYDVNLWKKNETVKDNFDYIDESDLNVYSMLKRNAASNKEFSISELMGQIQ